MIKGLKKYSAILGLTLSCALVTACNFKENKDIVITEGQELTERELKDINKKLDNIKIDYEYEDGYMSKDYLNGFISESKEEVYCEKVISSNDIDCLVKDIVTKIEANSSYYIENITFDINVYNIDNYDGKDFLFEGNNSFRELLYDYIYSLFENTDKEEWNSLYCSLSDTIILFSDDLKTDGRTLTIVFDDSNTGNKRYLQMIMLNVKKMDITSKISCLISDDYNEFLGGIFKSVLLHELKHCNQNYCNCWFQKNPAYFNKNVLSHYIYSMFIRESSASYFSEKIFPFSKNLAKHDCSLAYSEELEETYMIENALLLKDDYNKDDIFDNIVSINPKRICDWFGVANKSDYKDLLNMLTVFNFSNLNMKDRFEVIIDETYNENNQKKMEFKRRLFKEDAICQLVIYSYKNLINFTEENDISKDAFYFLFNTYQRYYLNKAKMYNSEDYGYYFGDEFREKFNLASDIVYDYASIKYGNKEKIQKEALENLEKTLDDGDYYSVIATINSKNSNGEYSSFDNTFPYMKELGPILGVEKYSAILNMAKEIENMPLLEYFNATDYSLDSYIESLENNNVMKKSIN